jgi:hypothetical protein
MNPGWMKQRFILDNDLKISIILFFFLILFQIVFILVKKDFNYLFGVEYGNVAYNLVSGKGYSNPLPPGDTGPTAWIPPILVFIISGGFLLFGKSVGAFVFLSFIKFITYTVIFYFLIKTLRLVNVKLNYIILLSIFLLYILFSPRDNFESIHDFWLPQLLVILFLYYSIKVYHFGSENQVGLYIVVFLSPLINPSYALAFMVMLGIIAFLIPISKGLLAKNKHDLPGIIKKSFVTILTFCFVFIFSISIWSARNYMVFNKFIPIKSNMWFEFYLTNIVDSDGKLSQSALYKAHPIYNESLRKEMLEQGEITWLEKYNGLSHEYLKNNFGNYLSKIKNRMILAYVFTETDRDNIRSENFPKFTEADQQTLIENKFIIAQDWTTGFYEDEKMREELNNLGLQDKENVFIDWKASKKTFYKNKFAIPDLTRGLFMGIIPTLCMILLLVFRETRKNAIVLTSIVLYIIYTVPYILISHQIRYQRPLFILQVILLYLVSIYIIHKFMLILKKPISMAE